MKETAVPASVGFCEEVSVTLMSALTVSESELETWFPTESVAVTAIVTDPVELMVSVQVEEDPHTDDPHSVHANTNGDVPDPTVAL